MLRAGADFSDLEKKFQTLQRKMKKWSRSLADMGRAFTTHLTMPILGAGIASIKYASDMQESMNKVEVAFGKNSDKVKEWSNTTLKSFGIAKGSSLDMAAMFGDMATSMKLPIDAATDMSMSLVGLAGDWASFKNISLDEAQTAAVGIFTGETESLKKLGYVMTQANLDAFSLANGINKTTKEMTQAELVQLRYAYIMDLSSNAHGDFERTGGGAANQMRVFTESLKELAATFGEILLPKFTEIVTAINEKIQAISNLDEETKKMIVKLAMFAASIGPVLMGLSKVLSIASGLPGKLKLVGAAFKLMTGPIGLVVAVIAALVLGVINLFQTNDEFRSNVIALWQDIGDSIGFVVQTIVDFFSWGWDLIDDIVAGHLVTMMAQLRNFATIIEQIFKIIKAVITGQWGEAWEAVKEIGRAVWDSILRIIENGINSMIRFVNVIIREINKVRAQHGIEPMDEFEEVELVQEDKPGKQEIGAWGSGYDPTAEPDDSIPTGGYSGSGGGSSYMPSFGGSTGSSSGTGKSTDDEEEDPGDRGITLNELVNAEIMAKLEKTLAEKGDISSADITADMLNALKEVENNPMAEKESKVMTVNQYYDIKTTVDEDEMANINKQGNMDLAYELGL
jgi:uncharacterized membrane protein YgcG